MTRLAISVEGQTEEAFIRDARTARLSPMGAAPKPVLLDRARTGGAGGVGRLASEMIHLHRSFDAATSLVDFHGFRGKEDIKVEVLENA